jgi:hypothetical protein
MSTHTPGPWMADGYLVCIPEDNAQIFLKMETMADASLIAAAPDLLAVCKNMLAAAHEGPMPMTPDWVIQFLKIHTEMRAAIAKAEAQS